MSIKENKRFVIFKCTEYGLEDTAERKDYTFMLCSDRDSMLQLLNMMNDKLVEQDSKIKYQRVKIDDLFSWQMRIKKKE